MVATAAFASFLREQLAALGSITTRRMFGKTGVFCEGVMLGMVTENVLHFRVDELNREALKEAEAFPTLNYVKGGQVIDLSFWRAPDRLFDENEELLVWARSALAAAHRVKSKRNPEHTKPNHRRSGASDA
jgi:DNA transformation protein and related proteins